MKTTKTNAAATIKVLVMNWCMCTTRKGKVVRDVQCPEHGAGEFRVF